MLINIFENSFLEKIQGYNTSNIKRRTSFVTFFERKSYIAVQAAFRQWFDQAPPCEKTIQQNVTKYRSHGRSLNRSKENSGRRRTACSEDVIELFRNILENNPNLTRICIQKCDRHVEWKFAEVVCHKCLSKQLFCKYETNLQENTHAEVWF